MEQAAPRRTANELLELLYSQAQSAGSRQPDGLNDPWHSWHMLLGAQFALAYFDHLSLDEIRAWEGRIQQLAASLRDIGPQQRT